MPHFSGLGSAIKSIQFFDISTVTSGTNATATINAVNTAKSIIIPTSLILSNTVNGQATYKLTNSTTVTCYQTSGGPVEMCGYVVEFV